MGDAELAEPLVPVLEALFIPPLRLWFRWHFEHLDRIPRTGPAIVAANHISYFDPVGNAYAVLRARRRPRFLAKHELFRIPVLGWVLRSVKQIPVRRGAGDRSPLEAAEAAIRAGEVVVVYPEGTVTKRPDFLPMDGKTGAVRLSLATGIPITPMASWGSQAIWQKSGPGSLRPGRPIWVCVGTPVDFSSRRGDADDHEAVRSMTAELMGRITDLVVDLRDRYPARWSTGTSR